MNGSDRRKVIRRVLGVSELRPKSTTELVASAPIASSPPSSSSSAAPFAPVSIALLGSHETRTGYVTLSITANSFTLKRVLSIAAASAQPLLTASSAFIVVPSP